MALISIESPFMKFMNRLVDVFLLNLLWLLFCLPIVTIGAATVAAFSVTLKMVDDEEGAYVRQFVTAFRTHFFRGTGLGLLHAAALYALFLDFQIVAASPDPSLVLLVASIVTAAFVFAAFLHAYALVARYESGVFRALQNSLGMSVRFFGRTGLLLAVLALEVAVFSWNTTMFFFGLAVGPMILIYTISGVAKGMFRRLDGESSPGSEKR